MIISLFIFVGNVWSMFLMDCGEVVGGTCLIDWGICLGLVFFISQIWLKEGVSSLGTSGG